MAISLSLPPIVTTALPILIGLPGNDFAKLDEILRGVPPRLYRKDVVDYILSKLDASEKTSFGQIPQAIASLHDGLLETDLSAREFIDAVVHEYERSSPLNDEARRTLDERLQTILNAPTLRLSSRARNVLFEQERTFQEARVVTDVRPLFSEEEAQLDAAVVVHNLRIEYSEAQTSKRFYVALDNKDIASLIDVLHRAQLKVNRLQAFLGTTNVTLIEEVEA
jgi:hypothetical protein